MAISLDGLSDAKVAAMNATLGELILPRAYVPIEPTLKQEWFLLQDALEVFFGGAAGPGKALALDVPIPTPTGWTTMRDVAAGDLVLDADGRPRRVIAGGPVQFGRPCLELEFSDGERVVCDEQHEWVTLTYQERSQAARRSPEHRSARRGARESRASGRKTEAFSSSLAARNAAREYDLLDPPKPRAREARAIAATLEHRGRVNHSVPVAAPLDLSTADLPVDPYTLGVWLGDGTTRDGSISNDPRDGQIIDEIPYRSWRLPSCPNCVRVEGLTTMLRAAGVLGDKHVPAAYLRGSLEQRLALLQGIVDTDGHVDRRDGRVEVTLTRWRLVEGVCELAATLGIRFSLSEGRAKLDGRDVGPRWRIGFQTGLQAARLERKRDAQHRGPFRRWHDQRYVAGARRVRSEPVRCIEVEGGIYLCGRRMVPTHNSWGLLMAALQYVQWQGYHALLLRPSLTEFEQQGGLIELSHEWLGRSGAWWHGGRREWRFPAGSSVRFGYLANEADLSHYPGGGVSFLGFDELTLFTERLYLGMFRLLRQAKNTLEGVPVRVRSASNPGNIGHAFVKGRFIDPETREAAAVFVPATIRDNPHLDYDVYLQTLSHMHPIDRERLVNGDWDVEEEGGKFRRSDFILTEEYACPTPVKAVRYWDLAATEPGPANPDPDFTVGILMTLDDDQMFTVRDVNMFRLGAAAVEAEVRDQAEADRGLEVPVATFIEQDPGAAGKTTLGHYQRNVLQGFECYAGSTKIAGRNAAKEVRARPVAAAVGNHLVRLVRGRSFREFLGQVAMFPHPSSHDDCVDGLSGAHTALTKNMGGPMRITSPVQSHLRVPTSVLDTVDYG